MYDSYFYDSHARHVNPTTENESDAMFSMNMSSSFADSLWLIQCTRQNH